MCHARGRLQTTLTAQNRWGLMCHARGKLQTTLTAQNRWGLSRFPGVPLAFFDHLAVCLLGSYRSYRPKPEPRKPSSWCVKQACWVLEALRGCLQCTDWQAFGDPRQNTEEYTYAVTSYIHFCQEVSVSRRRVKVFPNNSRGWRPVSMLSWCPQRKLSTAVTVRPTRKPSMTLSVGCQDQPQKAHMPSGRACSQLPITRGRVLLSQTMTPGWPTNWIASTPGLTSWTPFPSQLPDPDPKLSVKNVMLCV